MQPVGLLKEHGVNSLVVSGIGTGPFNRLQQHEIQVFFADRDQYPDVQSTIEGFINNKFPLLHPSQLCSGNGNCHHGESDKG
jgi:predicted Fe-Mo cluster-binding NifX family protein